MNKWQKDTKTEDEIQQRKNMTNLHTLDKSGAAGFRGSMTIVPSGRV